MIVRTFAIILFGILNINFSHSQEAIKWYDIEEAEALAKVNPKPIFIDAYTSWCGWCKHLDRTTFKDPQIVQLLNSSFYPVKYDAERKDTVTFQGKQYTNRFVGKTTKPTHDLSIELFKGSRMSYPTMFLFDGNFENKLPIQGYMDATKLAPFLVFYKEQQYGKANVNEFAYYFLNAHQGDTTNRFTGETEVNWMTMQEAFDANAKDPSKKIFVQIYHDYCETCKVVDSTNFKHPEIAKLLNDNFYPVKFDALSKEEFSIGSQKFINTETSGSPIHDFVLSIVPQGQTFSFPISLVFQDDHTLLDRAPRYMTPEFMEVFLAFFKDNGHLNKEQTFVEYMKSFDYKTR